MTARDRQDSRRSGVNQRADARPYSVRIRELIKWHERRANVKRTNATATAEPVARGILLGNADTHDVAAAVLQRVLDGKPVE